jgi:hypothetical protein
VRRGRAILLLTKRSAAALILAALLGALALAGGGFIWFVAIRPRRIMHRFDQFYARHPVGSSVADFVDDPFVEEISMADTQGKVIEIPAPGAIAKLRADVRSQASGQLSLQWTHTPPFGRLWIHVEFDAGRITSREQGETD